MPYLEILARRECNPHMNDNDQRLSAFVREATQCVSEVFGVGGESITLFFSRFDDDAYAHDGQLASHMQAGDDRAQRVLVKVHAYARPLALRRALAQALTPLLAACFDAPPARIAIYFMERHADEVAHGGVMSCDN